jgi:isopenicillin N synthase-like dioxygenase
LDKILSIDASLLRILHYPALNGDEELGAMRAAAHEDVNLLTILPVSEQPGLQVRDKAGHWHEVVGNVGDLIINSGDMLQEATGGFFPSTPHQVVNPEKNHDNVSRLSIPYFLTPRLDVRLSAQYTAGEFLAERLALLNR